MIKETIEKGIRVFNKSCGIGEFIEWDLSVVNKKSVAIVRFDKKILYIPKTELIEFDVVANDYINIG